METIIGLLFILLPIILKLIGKKFEDASQSPVGGMPDFTGDIGEMIDVFGEDYAPQPEPQPAPQQTPQPAPRPVHTFHMGAQVNPVKPKPVQPRPKSPILQEEVEAPREPIDLKKLIIYSEIMNPKYDS